MRKNGNPKIIGYVTLVCGEIEAQDGLTLEDEDAGYPYDTYPAVKLARLLVDADERGNDVGTTLVDFVLGTAKMAVCPAVGCRFVIVDAKQASIGFYEKCGFTIIDTATNKARSEPIMFIDLHKASTASKKSR
jgi:GNAT superfamily N-acetyltransferase